ncbi:hypothetical protein [Micromonospora inositola]|uniref:Uncharacterized protein n=1 Tax=Micromonospora inositola TaxID=47865 RepID=A0A1C5HUB0_9ACTN|nr:hypothetical protein [Micromonospora inositola]SCG49606.1 hypothetical protein GA0070613_1832 [Micromonospora inositola]
MTLLPGTNSSSIAGRSLLAAALSMLVAAGTVVTTAAPAAAYDVRYETNTSWAWTDSQRPKKINIDEAGDVPVGSWVDAKGHQHTARAYFTFDISRYLGADIEFAKFDAKETGAADCTKRPEVELWRTAPYTSGSSWVKPPADLARIDTTKLPDQSGCPAPYVGFDATAGLRQALAEGQRTLTLSLRLPAAVEADPALLRRYASKVGLSVDHNFRPGVPTDLQTSGTGCTAAEPYQLVRRGDLGLSGILHDKDRNDTGGTDMLTATVALWPVDQPDARIERTDNARDGERAVGRFSYDLFQHDRVYAWQMRAADSRATGEWSATCYFRTDFQGPAAAPVVSSTDFPADGHAPALAGEFTFDGSGASDVVGFDYELNDVKTGTVPAARPGGTATVTLTPRVAVNRLEVWSVDTAGNRSPRAEYSFFGDDVSPLVDGNLTEVGVPTTFAVRPRLQGVVRYRFGLDGDPEQTVAANADGTASLTVTATKGGNRTLSVTSVTADGVEATAQLSFQLLTEPKISATVYEEYGYGGGQGVPGVFTFTPRLPDTVSYRYSFAGETGTVAAGADGTGSVTWTPTEAGYVYLSVVSVSRDGTESDPASWFFEVRDLLPTIYGVLYNDNYYAGGPGQAGEFRFSSAVPDTVEFRYRFDGGAEQGVGADGNGNASVTWTPDQGGTHTLTVRSVTADGTVSAERTFTFLVNDAPLVESAQYPKDASSGLPGVPGVFTFRPQRPDVVTYHYAFYGEEEKTVEAATDGTASVTWTPERAGWTMLTVRAVTGDGTVTQSREYAFTVRDPKPTIVSYLYNEYDPQGGIGVPGGFRFSSELPDTVDFVYRLNDGPEQTVAVTDGTAADLSVTPDRGFRNTLTVRARSASGELSPEATYSFMVSTSPTVTSPTYPSGEAAGGVGAPGVFTFAPRMPDVATYVYQFDNGPEVTVPAGADGTASVTLTPTEARWYPISVYAVDKDGNRSDYAYYWFVVQG